MTIKSKPASAEYRDNYDRIFQKSVTITVSRLEAIELGISQVELETLVRSRLSAAGADLSAGRLTTSHDPHRADYTITWTPDK